MTTSNGIIKTFVKSLPNGSFIEHWQIQLDPCPVCGGEGKLVRLPENGMWDEVRCLNADCPTGFRTGCYKDPEKAVEAWNGIKSNPFRPKQPLLVVTG